MAGLAERLRNQLPLPYVVTVAIFASMPLWTRRVGLYDYLALEILIWSLFAMSYNLMLGYTGLPSFGHAAFFGIGAYAFGLLQLKVYRTCGPAWRLRSSQRRLPGRSWRASSRIAAASIMRC